MFRAFSVFLEVKVDDLEKIREQIKKGKSEG
jgi:hypothetical protein